eukprot:8757615-Pyramimonas_sp.AAC.1
MCIRDRARSSADPASAIRRQSSPALLNGSPRTQERGAGQHRPPALARSPHGARRLSSVVGRPC